jgi:hypothetical protein
LAICVTAVVFVAAALFGCGGSSSTETSTAKSYSTGTKLGERGPSPIDPVELSGPLAVELEKYLIKNYEGESWYPSLEDVWSADGTVIVSTGLDGSTKSEKIAEEVCAVLHKAKVKSRVKTILINYGYNENFEC